MFWSALPKICAMPFDPPPFRQSISTSSTTRRAAALSMRMPCVAEPVILERRIVTFAALTTIWPPWTCRFWMTVPGVLTTRFPVWGVRTVPAGTPVLVGPGHAAEGGGGAVVVAVGGAATVRFVGSVVGVVGSVVVV